MWNIFPEITAIQINNNYTAGIMTKVKICDIVKKDEKNGSEHRSGKGNNHEENNGNEFRPE